MTTSLETKKKWITGVQLAATLAGALAVVLLRIRGIRFLGYVPTLVFVWIPLFAGTAALFRVSAAPRKAWTGWTIGLVTMILLTAYLAVGETPSALIPVR